MEISNGVIWLVVFFYYNLVQGSHFVHEEVQSVLANVDNKYRTGYHFQPSKHWINATTAAGAKASTETLCQTQCGNITIPYPFGIGPECFRTGFNLVCNHSSTSGPKLYLGNGTFEVTDILLTQGQIIVRNHMQSFFCDSDEHVKDSNTMLMVLGGSGPYTFSSTRNTFITISCSSISYVYSMSNIINSSTSLCAAICFDFTGVQRTNGSCTGIGCCQTPIGAGAFQLYVRIVNVENLTGPGDIGPCTKAFLVDHEWFRFNPVQLANPDFYSKDFTVPVVLDWAIPWDTTQNNLWSCGYAGKNLTTYACPSEFSECMEADIGYRCKCSLGFEGNPYVSNGCHDIDECSLDRNPCLTASCINTPGSYSCYCPKGTRSILEGDPKYGCSPNKSQIKKGIIISIGGGAGLGVLILFVASFLLYKRIEQMNIKKQRKTWFRKNHGLLLQQLLNSNEDYVERTKIFTLEELEKATNKFDATRILGRGGHGTVYKGILSDQRVVAIKRAKIVEQIEIEQFINEIAILSQINHRNIVKLFGCCLEDEVPLLVYEFISGGTLSDHLHVVGNHVSSLSFDDRLRIATEIASALAYLHSAASISIFHRDIKSSNILLDHNYTAKVADFGTSRSIPSDKTRVTTIVQGTFGYLDPEYFYTGQLTEKSDVYSFGIMLVELLTGERAISHTLLKQEKNLAMHFICSLEENRLSQILDVRVAEEGRMEELEAIALLAEKCLSLKGEERPTMKSVEQTLNRLCKTKKQKYNTSNKQNCEESKSFMNNILRRSSTNDATRSYSLENEFMDSIEYPR